MGEKLRILAIAMLGTCSSAFSKCEVLPALAKLLERDVIILVQRKWSPAGNLPTIKNGVEVTIPSSYEDSLTLLNAMVEATLSSCRLSKYFDLKSENGLRYFLTMAINESLSNAVKANGN